MNVEFERALHGDIGYDEAMRLATERSYVCFVRIGSKTFEENCQDITKTTLLAMDGGEAPVAERRQHTQFQQQGHGEID